MLLSHAHRFIYLKTRKTAGTSVEVLLEPLCAPPGHVVKHGAPETVTPFGIIGFRGKRDLGGDATFRNHMSAAVIRDFLPDEFAAYARIANVRNPYDKTISGYHHWSGTTVAEASRLASEDPAKLRELFVGLLPKALIDEKDTLLIDGSSVVSHVVRFEALQSDLEALNASLNLGLGDLSTKLPKLKMTARKTSGPPWLAYLNRQSIRTINERMGWYFDMFGYEKLDPNSADVPP